MGKHGQIKLCLLVVCMANISQGFLVLTLSSVTFNLFWHTGGNRAHGFKLDNQQIREPTILRSKDAKKRAKNACPAIVKCVESWVKDGKSTT